jgi:hypothetical protein
VPQQPAPEAAGAVPRQPNDPAVAGVPAATGGAQRLASADGPKDAADATAALRPFAASPNPAASDTTAPAALPDSALPQAIQATPALASAAPAPANGTGDASPAAQVAPALMSLVQTPGGNQRLTLHLEPATLGHLQIQIDRAPDATARVDITVQRPQTLELLLRDQPQLQRALDQAGVPQEGRTLTLHLAAPETGTSPFGSQGQAQSGAWGNAGFGNHSGGNGFANGSPRNGGDAKGNAGTGPDTTQTAVPRQYRAGLDITA